VALNLLSGAANDSYVFFGNSSAGNAGYIGYENTANRLVLRSSDYVSLLDGTGEVIRIDGGNVGIGTTSPVTKLEVNGTVTISGPSAVKWKYSDNYAYFGIGYISGANYGFYNYNYGRADLYIQQSTGNVGIGTSSPAYLLDVNGTARFGSATYKVLSVSDAGGAGWGTVGGVSTAPQLYMYSTGTNAVVQTYINNTARLEVTNTGITVTGAATFSSTVTTGSPISIKDSAPYIQWLNNSSVRLGYIQHNASNLVYNADTGIHVFNQAATFSSTVTASSYYASNGGDFAWGDGSTYIDGDSSNQYIRAIINNSEKLRIVSNGIGIGTTSPSTYGANLAVIGSGNGIIAIGQGTSYTTLQSNGQDFYLNMKGSGSTVFRNGSGDTERMRIDSSGNVGIGTTSPAYKLDVVGEARFGSNYKAIIGNDGTYGAYSTIGFGGTSNGYNRVFGQDGTADGLYLASATGRGISFRVNGGTTDNMFINSGGNVGIGTTSPAYKLDVVGNGRFSTNIDVLGIIYGLSNKMLDQSSTYTRLYDAAGTLVMSLGSGNVGIGTTSPFTKFHVSAGYGLVNNGYSWAVFNSASNGFAAQFGAANDVAFANTGNNAIISVTGSNSILFGTNSTEKMRITSAGNVGIGTTSPAQLLHVLAATGIYAYARIEGGLGGYGGFLELMSNSVGSSTDSAGRLDFYMTSTNRIATIDAQRTAAGANYGTLILSTANNATTPTERMRITSGGNVGIGNTSPQARLDLGSGYGANGEKFIIYNDNNSSALAGTKVGFYMDRFGLSNNSTFVFPTDTVGNPGSYVIASKDTSGTTLVARMAVLGQSGNVGIGTTSPASLLHLYSTNGSPQGITIQGGDESFVKFLQGAGGVKNWGLITTNLAAGDFGIYQSDSAGGDPFSAGTAKMYFNNDGNVGIGTTSPSEKLSVYGNARIDSNDAASQLYFYNSGTILGSIGKGNYAITGADYNGISMYSVGAMSFAAGGQTERMRITAGGNVGIGTATPTSLLYVYNDVAYSAANLNEVTGSSMAFKIRSRNSTNSEIVMGAMGEDNTGLQAINNSTAAALKFVINPFGGNVGIGTTSPLFNLQVGENAGTIATTTIRLQNSYLNTNGYYGFNIDAVDNGVDGHDLRFLGRTSPTGAFSELVRIKNTGNVGIGTTAPQKPLEVITAASNFASVGVNALAIGEWTGIHFGYRESNSLYRKSAIVFQRTGSAAEGIIHFLNNSDADNSSATLANSRMVITSTGNVGIGTASPDSSLEVNGRVSIRGGNELYFGQSTSAIGTWTTRMYASGSTHKFNASTFIFNNEGYGGSEYMRITSAGNIGVNTTTPYAGTGVTSVTINASAYPILAFQNNGSRTGEIIGYYNHLALNTPGFIALSPGDAEAMRITSGGNVGVGIIPSAWGANDKAIEIGGSNSSTYTGLNVTSVAKNCYYDGTNWIYKQSGVSSLLYQQSFLGSHIFYNAGSGTAGGTIAFAERMRITDTGNVGIGTASPVSKLQVQDGDIRLQSSGGNPSILFGSYGVSTSYPQGSMVLSDAGFYGGNFDFYTKANGAATNGLNFIMRLGSEGNVGIGTTSPTSKVSISDGVSMYSAETGVMLDIKRNVTNGNNTTSKTGIRLGNNSNSFSIFYGGTSDRLRFIDGGEVEVMSLVNGGNVGIGTTAPSDELTVNSAGNSTGIAIQRSGVTKGLLEIGSSSDTFAISATSATGILTFATNSSERMRIASTGNVGIGTTSPSYNLHVEGNVSGISIYASHDIAAFSDITVKKEVKRIENAIEKVKELNGYTYVRTDDETGTRRAGVIAQEVQKVLPEVVSANPDGTLNVAYSNMIALLIEGMKEQQATIEKLQSEINELKK
jgi:hypothetical protein